MTATTAVSPQPAGLRHLLSDRASATQSSALRDLLAQAKRPGMISLAGGLPDPSSFPNAKLAAIASRVIVAGDGVLQYASTAGTDRARAALATLFGPTTAGDDVVVTSGSQQALDLIARSVLNPGDQVVAGDPDYLGALQVFRSCGADVHAITVDADGIDTHQLGDQLRKGLRPRCCYIVPNFHNPTGSSLAPDRRIHLDELAARYGFLIIEDDPYRELYYDAPPPPSAVASENLVQLRSTSKTLAPGLRIGAMVGPRWLRDAVVKAKQSVDLHTSALSQAIVAEALHAPWYATHVEENRSLYRAKRDALANAAIGEFGDEVVFTLPRGGMFLWAQFAQGTDTREWLQSCLDRNVCFVPGAEFAVARDLSRYARLSFATGSCSELHEAVARMRRAMR